MSVKHAPAVATMSSTSERPRPLLQWKTTSPTMSPPQRAKMPTHSDAGASTRPGAVLGVSPSPRSSSTGQDDTVVATAISLGTTRELCAGSQPGCATTTCRTTDCLRWASCAETLGVITVWMRTSSLSGPWTTPSNVTLSDDTGDGWFKTEKPSLNVASGFPPLSPPRTTQIVLSLPAMRRRTKFCPMALSSRTSAAATLSTHQNSIFFFAESLSFFAESFSVASTLTSMKMWPGVAGESCALTATVICAMGVKSRHPNLWERPSSAARLVQHPAALSSWAMP